MLQPLSRATLYELVEWMCILLRNQCDDRTYEGFEDLDNGGVRVRAFVPTPGPEPEESIVEATLHIEGETPTDDDLVRIEFTTSLHSADEPGDVIFVSLSAMAVASILLGY